MIAEWPGGQGHILGYIVSKKNSNEVAIKENRDEEVEWVSWMRFWPDQTHWRGNSNKNQKQVILEAGVSCICSNQMELELK